MTVSSPPEDRMVVVLLLVLTLVTGLVDAVSYLALGRVFTANMTGNVVFLGFALAGAPGLSLGRSGAALAAFLGGAVIGGRVAVRLTAGGRRLLLGVAFAIEAGLLFAATAATAISAGDLLKGIAGLYSVICLTALAMGLRNAVVRKLGVRDLTTTVLTMTLTGLAADSRLAGGTDMGWGRRASTVVLMLIGAGAGAWLLQYSPALTLGIAGTLAGLCALGAVLGMAPTAPVNRPQPNATP